MNAPTCPGGIISCSPSPPRFAARSRLSGFSQSPPAASITASALVFAAPVLTLLIITRCPPAHHAITW